MAKQPQDEKRAGKVAELLATEKNYLQRLSVLWNNFYLPLNDNLTSDNPFITRANIHAIFGELKVIISLNKFIFGELELSVKGEDYASAKVGHVFAKYASLLRWYHSYVSNYENAFKTIKSLTSKRANFRSFIAQVEAKPEVNYTDLESFLILPVQRIPQYNILFADLVKVTNDSHADYAHCVEALSILSSVGNYINEKKRESENIQQVIEIGKTLAGFPNLAVPYRRFLKQGKLIMVTELSLSANASPVYLFVFSDIILVTQDSSDSSTAGQKQVLQYAYWDRVILNSDPDILMPLVFQVKLKDSNYFLVTNTVDEKNEWTAIFRDQIQWTKQRNAEKEIQLTLKKQLQALHNNNAVKGSLAIRGLGVLASKTMIDDLHDMSLTSPTSYSTSSSSPHGINLSTQQQVNNQSSTSSDSSSNSNGNQNNSTNYGSNNQSSMNSSTDVTVRSKKTKESIEAELKNYLTKEGVEEGSIDLFLKEQGIAASYAVPIFLPSKGNTSALLTIGICSFHVFIKSKLHMMAHLYDIKEIQSKHHPDFLLKVSSNSGGNPSGSNSGSYNNSEKELSLEVRSEFCDDIIFQFRKSYLTTYYGIPEPMMWTISTDEWRMPRIQIAQERLAFGGFSRSYKAACLYLGIPDRMDLLWDIIHHPNLNSLLKPQKQSQASSISSNSQDDQSDPYTPSELDFSSLDDLSPSDIKAIMFALRHNVFFTSLNFKDVTLVREAVLSIADTMKHNTTIRKIHLQNNGLSKESISCFTESFNTSPSVNLRRLECVNISNNSVEMVPFLTKFLETNRKIANLTTLDLSNSNLNSKFTSSLFVLLKKTTNLYHTLTKLNISGNRLDGDASASIAAFLATPSALRDLDLSNTQIKLIQTMEAITRGCIYLTKLNLSQNKVGKKGEASSICKFLGKTDSLTDLLVNDMNMPPESVTLILEAASANVYVTKLNIFADSNNFGPLGASLISKTFKKLSGIIELSMSENDFGDEGLSAIFQTISNMPSPIPSLQKLVLDGNWKFRTSKSRSSSIAHLITMATHKNCQLKHLSIAAGDKSTSSLKHDLIPFFENLPKVKFSELNISGHRMGSKGVLALARALQVSPTLQKIWFDENSTTPDSFSKLVTMIQGNSSLVHVSIPILDLSPFVVQGEAKTVKMVQKSFALLSSQLYSNEQALLSSIPSAGSKPNVNTNPTQGKQQKASLAQQKEANITELAGTQAAAAKAGGGAHANNNNSRPTKDPNTMNAMASLAMTLHGSGKRDTSDGAVKEQSNVIIIANSSPNSDNQQTNQKQARPKSKTTDDLIQKKHATLATPLSNASKPKGQKQQTKLAKPQQQQPEKQQQLPQQQEKQPQSPRSKKRHLKAPSGSGLEHMEINVKNESSSLEEKAYLEQSVSPRGNAAGGVSDASTSSMTADIATLRASLDEDSPVQSLHSDNPDQQQEPLRLSRKHKKSLTDAPFIAAAVSRGAEASVSNQRKDLLPNYEEEEEEEEENESDLEVGQEIRDIEASNEVTEDEDLATFENQNDQPKEEDDVLLNDQAIIERDRESAEEDMNTEDSNSQPVDEEEDHVEHHQLETLESLNKDERQDAAEEPPTLPIIPSAPSPPRSARSAGNEPEDQEEEEESESWSPLSQGPSDRVATQKRRSSTPETKAEELPTTTITAITAAERTKRKFVPSESFSRLQRAVLALDENYLLPEDELLRAHSSFSSSSLPIIVDTHPNSSTTNPKDEAAERPKTQTSPKIQSKGKLSSENPTSAEDTPADSNAIDDDGGDHDHLQAEGSESESDHEWGPHESSPVLPEEETNPPTSSQPKSNDDTSKPTNIVISSPKTGKRKKKRKN